MITKNILGSKYYTYLDNDEILKIRVVGFNSSDNVTIKNLSTGDHFKINIEDLNSKFTKLLPDGILSIATVGISDDTYLQDVIVAYARTNDILEGNNIPSIICRQNINDVFDLVKNNNRMIVGCCATPGSVPDKVPYQSLFAANSINSELFVSTYIDDDLTDIFECIKTKKYDKILEELFDNAISSCNSYQKKVALENRDYYGYKLSLKELLIDNSFMDEYYITNGILKLNIVINESNNFFLNPIQLDFIERVVGIKFNTHMIIKYGNDLDTDKIHNGNYIYIKDKENNLYVLEYTSDSVIDPEKIDYSLLYFKK